MQLADNLRESYMDGKPTFVTVVLNSDGFGELVARFEYLRRIARRNASVLGDTRDARIKVKGMTAELKKLRGTYAELARTAEDDRDEADALAHRAAQPRGRPAAQAQRHRGAARVRAGPDRHHPAPPARRRPARAGRPDGDHAAPKVSSGRRGESPAVGGDVVGRIVAAANEIATTPYVWGGGHGGNSRRLRLLGLDLLRARGRRACSAARSTSGGFMS